MDMTWFWAVFVGIVLTLLALDLGVFHRKSHEVHFREALTWTGVWIGTALLFNLGVYIWMGPQPALEFLTGYLIEYSLSVDNVFVFALIFSYFAVPAAYRHRVLFWGILGALVFRAIFIAGGIALMERFHWLVYVFGAFLIVTGIRMALEKDKEIHPERNPVIRLFKRLMPVTDRYDGDRFFTVQNAKRVATPLFVALLVVEVSDLIFAVDSIPAILAITRDPFIVYTSNVFAILGLRSLYFALAGIMKLFHHLHYGLAVILSFVGVKLMLSGVFKIPTGISLGIVFGVLALSVIASLLWPPKEPSKTVA
jgi:tellurite resistance protein TerC